MVSWYCNELLKKDEDFQRKVEEISKLIAGITTEDEAKIEEVSRLIVDAVKTIEEKEVE